METVLQQKQINVDNLHVWYSLNVSNYFSVGSGFRLAVLILSHPRPTTHMAGGIPTRNTLQEFLGLCAISSEFPVIPPHWLCCINSD